MEVEKTELEEWDADIVKFIKNLGLDTYDPRENSKVKPKYKLRKEKWETYEALNKLPDDVKEKPAIKDTLKELRADMETLNNELRELLKERVLWLLSDYYLAYWYVMEEHPELDE